ncbi:MAG: FecR family protein [Chryseobacterium sp.]|jgi:ferric-dicitrate binding protein FerR (iron transport regulator)|uniref:FecR family protein n=1 Tax=Chryseobacterium sp. TaxID=1871047 RepID=UPI002839D8BC|nr:FecR family protein [Chryseobacterium sp.]MDR2238099.1 FecR family protein [Chryseobacterium sp.]
MSLDKEFEESWESISEEKNEMHPVTDRRIWATMNRKIRKKKNTGRLFWAAAVMIPFFILLMTYRLSQNTTVPMEQNYAYESFNTSKMIRLSDGSTVTLMPYSKLTLSKNFGVKDRQISFIGQGNFNITKDTSKPFRINAGNFQVQVLGTHFYLDQKSEERKIELYEGKVKVEHLGKITYLLPEEIWLSSNEHSNDHYYSPKKPMSFTVDHLKYSEAVKRLEKTYNVRISYPDQYQDRIVNGSFNGDLKSILSIISYPFNLKIKKYDAKEIELK